MGHVHGRLIAFDLDGTLVDSRRDLADSVNDLIVERGGAALPMADVVSMVGEGAAVLVRRALAAAGIADAGTALSRFLDIYDTRLLNHTTLYPGISELLQDVSRHATIAVLTNKPLAPSRRILDALAIGTFVEEVIGGDGPYARKPDPAGLHALMATCGTDDRATLMVGDSEIDRRTARAAGVACCLVTYGFGRPTPPTGADEWIVDTVSDAAEVIARWCESARPPGASRLRASRS